MGSIPHFQRRNKVNKLVEKIMLKPSDLVNKVIEIWKEQKAKPIGGYFGIEVSDGVFTLTKRKECCAVGALCIGLKHPKKKRFTTEDVMLAVAQHYDIPLHAISSFIDGFDVGFDGLLPDTVLPGIDGTWYGAGYRLGNECLSD